MEFSKILLVIGIVSVLMFLFIVIIKSFTTGEEREEMIKKALSIIKNISDEKSRMKILKRHAYRRHAQKLYSKSLDYIKDEENRMTLAKLIDYEWGFCTEIIRSMKDDKNIILILKNNKENYHLCSVAMKSFKFSEKGVSYKEELMKEMNYDKDFVSALDDHMKRNPDACEKKSISPTSFHGYGSGTCA